MNHFLIFAFFGVGVEVIFTAIKSLLTQNPRNWSLTGTSHLWMFPIYGSIAFLFPPVYQVASLWPLVLRALIYGVAILIIEFISGYLIKTLTGKIPWYYESRWSIRGYIRLDYLPYWMILGVIIEYIYLRL